LINDAHCHFFSRAFFQALARQKADLAPATVGLYDSPPDKPSGVEADLQVRLDSLYRELGWDDPGDPEGLADRWVRELDANGVHRAALIASVPGDEASVAAAVARHPTRIVGFFMVDSSGADAPARTRRALTDHRLSGVCLFPAMHHVPLDDNQTLRVVDAAAGCPGAVVFAHCGLLSVGVRDKLGLPSRFDLTLGDPLALSRLAQAFPAVPFIIPHFGAGRFREALTAVENSANVHLDTSSSNSWTRQTPGLTLAAVYETAIAAAGASRLLFGTDSSFFPRGWQRGICEGQKTILADLGVSSQDRALIFGGNFERLFPHRQTSDVLHRQT
jgi:predicted TIM-barrel fold metal-dependent hydrolase